MGRYPNSKIHNMYSDWHYRLIEIDDKYRQLYCADIDRLWIEYDFESEAIVGVIDIKWDNSVDTLTPTENGIYNWFRQHDVKVFTVFINYDFSTFRAVNYLGQEKTFTAIEYADWLLGWRKHAKENK